MAQVSQPESEAFTSEPTVAGNDAAVANRLADQYEQSGIPSHLAYSNDSFDNPDFLRQQLGI